MAIFAKKQEAKGADNKTGAGGKGNGRKSEDVKADEPTKAPAEVSAAEVVATAAAATPAVEEPPSSPEIDTEVIEPVELDASVMEGIEGIDVADAAPSDGAAPRFGIADAIRLMHSLPNDPNMDLVVRVVRVTLGAVNVSVEEIAADALRREKLLQDNVALLQVQVADLEKQLYARRCEITALETDLKETVSVRERLQMAEKYTGHRPPPTPADATRGAVTPKAADWPSEWEKTERLREG